MEYSNGTYDMVVCIAALSKLIFHFTEIEVSSSESDNVFNCAVSQSSAVPLAHAGFFQRL